MPLTYQQFKQLYTKYERLLIPGMLLFGFVVDLITFRVLNIRMAFLLLGMHAVVVGSVIIFLNSFDDGRHRLGKKHPLRYLRLAAPLLLQFSMGALLSAVMIFYLFSGAFAVSWPFLLIVAFLMLSNEIFREYYLQPTVQLPVYYLALFLLGALMLPFVLKTIHMGVFILAGMLAMVIVYVMYAILRRLVPPIRREEPMLILLIGGVFGGMLALHITNIIPPIPLSVRDMGVYYAVERVGDTYQVLDEEPSWVDRLPLRQTIHYTPESPVYVASAIFAPTDLRIDVVHLWEWFDPEARTWQTMDTLGFSITGGRDAGYRGYSYKSSVPEGKWRVSVATRSGNIIGRLRFTVVMEDGLPELVWREW